MLGPTVFRAIFRVATRTTLRATLYDTTLRSLEAPCLAGTYRSLGYDALHP